MPEESIKVASVILNPLLFFEAEFAPSTGQEVTVDHFLRFITQQPLESTLEAMIRRYREIASRPRKLSSAPAEDNILKKLVWPLRQAMVCYILGNYLGTIALCGAVAEMLAILIFEITPLTLGGSSVDEEKQIGLFGSKFERLGQERRIDILHTFGLISTEMKSQFNLVRTKRRSYMHSFSFEHTHLAEDALAMFYAAEDVVAPVIGQQIAQNKFQINPALVNYLEQHGIIRDYIPEGVRSVVPESMTNVETINGT